MVMGELFYCWIDYLLAKTIPYWYSWKLNKRLIVSIETLKIFNFNSNNFLYSYYVLVK